ncbi:MAG TPA: sensor histidine kinase [Phycisphaerales bacterium]|nr:sensor histidine kinase [Phycisphaerales bacterium]
MLQAESQRHSRSWSIARRLFGISLLLILVQAMGSSVVTTQLRRHFFHEFLENTLSRQIVSSYNVISDRLDQLSVEEAYACCSLEDYRNWLDGLSFENGKVGLIIGEAGLQATRDADRFYKTSELSGYAKETIASVSGFKINASDNEAPLAVKAVKLPGGPETGFYVYMRPVYSMPLVRTLVQIKMVSELVLMLLLALALLVSLRLIFRPVRRIQSELSGIELNHLERADLSSRDRPREFQPLLQEFNAMVERLRRSSADQKQFASTISHEFRTPMTVISGFIQSVLNRDNDLRRQSRDALILANQEVLRLNRMLSDLLDLSRADNNQLKLRQEPFDCLKSLHDSFNLAKITHPNNNFSLHVHSDASPIWAIGDVDRLTQCLHNLVGNAVKYSAENSTIELHLNQHEGNIVISVVDHGQGIPEDQHEIIFQRFQRAEGVILHRGDSSSGLGLSIVQTLMKGMGGNVHVESHIGIGSRFVLTLQQTEI